MICSKRQVRVYFLTLALAPPFTASAASLSITDAVELAKKNNLELREQQVQAETAERRIDAASVLFQDNPEFARRERCAPTPTVGLRSLMQPPTSA